MLINTGITYSSRPQRDTTKKSAEKMCIGEILLILVFLLGLSAGAIYISSSQDYLSSYIKYTTVQAVSASGSAGWLALFAAGFLPKLLFLLCVSLSGVCAVGGPIIYLLFAAFGCGAGAVAGWIYASLAAKGLLYNLVIFAPTQLLFLLFVFGTASRGVKLGRALFACLLTNEFSDYTELKHSYGRSILKSAVAAGAAGAYYAFMSRLLGEVFG